MIDTVIYLQCLSVKKPGYLGLPGISHLRRLMTGRFKTAPLSVNIQKKRAPWKL
jgi:hypothetical protein